MQHSFTKGFMTGNNSFAFDDVAILSVEAVDAPEVITSADIEAKLEPFYARTDARRGLLQDLAGIQERRVWPEGTSFMEAAAKAGERAIAESGIDRERIGLMIDSSVCRARLEPSSAVTVHDILGLPTSCLNFDVSNACLGFLNGMHLAGLMLEAGQIDYALVVDGEDIREIHQNTIERLNRPEATVEDLFDNFATLTLGAGSAAMVLGRHSENPGGHRLKGGFFRANTSYNHLCVGSLDGMRTDARGLLEAGSQVAKLAWEDAEGSEDWRNMDRYVLHQVSEVHTQAIIDTLGIDGERLPRSFPLYGNIGPAAIPVTLAKASPDLSSGDKVLLMGMGSGINTAFVEIEW